MSNRFRAESGYRTTDRQPQIIYKPFRKLRKLSSYNNRDGKRTFTGKLNIKPKSIYTIVAEPTGKRLSAPIYRIVILTPLIRHPICNLTACHTVIGEDKTHTTSKGREQSANHDCIINTGHGFGLRWTIGKRAEDESEAESKGQQSMCKLFQGNHLTK